MKQIRLYQIITAISCLFLISCGIEQNLKKADKHLSLGEYYDAATQYKKVYTKTPTKERAARGKVALKMHAAMIKSTVRQRHWLPTAMPSDTSRQTSTTAWLTPGFS